MKISDKNTVIQQIAILFGFHYQNTSHWSGSLDRVFTKLLVRQTLLRAFESEVRHRISKETLNFKEVRLKSSSI